MIEGEDKMSKALCCLLRGDEVCFYCGDGICYIHSSPVNGSCCLECENYAVIHMRLEGVPLAKEGYGAYAFLKTEVELEDESLLVAGAFPKRKVSDGDRW